MNKRIPIACILLLGSVAVVLAQEDGGLDFTQGDLAAQTIGPIKAEADRPQVVLLPKRISPEFKRYELDERSFVDEILSTATHQQLNKKFKRRTFQVEVPESE